MINLAEAVRTDAPAQGENTHGHRNADSFAGAPPSAGARLAEKAGNGLENCCPGRWPAYVLLPGQEHHFRGCGGDIYSRIVSRSEVRLTVGGEDLIPGQVTRVHGQLASIRFTQPLDSARLLRATDKAPASRRCLPRVNVAARAILRTSGRTVSGELFNISPAGAKVRASRRLSEGQWVSLTLPDLPAIMGFVRWKNEREFGLVFQKPVPVQLLARWSAERLRVSA